MGAEELRDARQQLRRIPAVIIREGDDVRIPTAVQSDVAT
jgi:hypothetical protein